MSRPRLGVIAFALLVSSALFVTAGSPTTASKAGTRLDAGPGERTGQQNLPILHVSYLATGYPLSKLTFDPAYVSATVPADVAALTNANLVTVLPNGKVVPGLAHWRVSTNHLVYTFTIRSNAHFSNGHPVTAKDAVFSLERALAPSTNSPTAATYLGLIKGADDFAQGKIKVLAGVKVLGLRVLQITITRPVTYFLGAFSFVVADILDPTVVGGKPVSQTNNYLTTTCAGNQGPGPFMFVCRNNSSTPSSFYSSSGTPTYTLVPNPYFYGPKPHIRIMIPSYQESYRQYVAGKLDMTAVPLAYLDRWKGKSKEYHAYRSPRVRYLTPNTHLTPFNDVHCRLAVASAIDRGTLANNVLQGGYRETYAVLPKGMLGYYAGKDNPHYDPKRAKAELAKCPSRNIPFELAYSGSDRASDNEFRAISTMLSAVGMNVKIKALGDNWGTVVDESLDKSKTQIVEDAWFADYPDPQDYCTLLLRSGQHYNLGGWHNAVYDRLVDRAELTFNLQKRGRLYIQAQHIALGQGAWISLFQDLSSFLVKPYVHGLDYSVTYARPVPKNYDWANVSISKH